MPAVIRRRDIYDEGQVKPRSPRGDVDLALKLGVRAGRAWLMATHLGLEPCWGKLDARHLRGGAGNVAMRAGLRPTAKAVDSPPDATAGAPALYPTPSHSVDDGRCSRDRPRKAMRLSTAGRRRGSQLLGPIRPTAHRCGGSSGRSDRGGAKRSERVGLAQAARRT